MGAVRAPWHFADGMIDSWRPCLQRSFEFGACDGPLAITEPKWHVWKTAGETHFLKMMMAKMELGHIMWRNFPLTSPTPRSDWKNGMCASSNNVGCFPFVRANAPFGFYEHLSRWLVFFFSYAPSSTGECFSSAFSDRDYKFIGAGTGVFLENIFDHLCTHLAALTWGIALIVKQYEKKSWKTMTHVGMKWHASSVKYGETHIFPWYMFFWLYENHVLNLKS